MTQQTSYFPLAGGLDMITPAITTPAGRAIAGMNYEPAPNGYRRIDGFERFDGKLKPSDASYSVLNYDGGTGAIAQGDIVTGETSGASGYVLVDGVVESGSYDDGDAAGYLILTAIVGTFEDNENLQVDGATKCVADGEAVDRGAGNDTDDTTWYHAAIERARDQIGQVPGSGRIRGVWVYKGDVYAFRDNENGTAGVMHKATSSGWAEQSLGHQIAFSAGGYIELPFESGGYMEIGFTSGGYIELPFTSGGTHEVVAGEEIKGATSGATATVASVNLTSGTWAAGTAAGTFILSVQSGRFEFENLNVGSTTNVASVSGNSFVTQIKAGDTITGATSNATAVVEKVTLDSGSWEGGNAAGTLRLSTQTGTFQAEDLKVGSASNVATIAEDPHVRTIQPGYVLIGEDSGATGVVVSVNLESGAWRTGDAAGTIVLSVQTGLFRAEDLNTDLLTNVASATGNSTATAIEDGDTITGATSGATATVDRVVMNAGSWEEGTASGYLVISGQTGTFEEEDLNVGDTENIASVAGDAEAITLPAGGRYEFVNHNFFGASNRYRMYGCNGVGKAFEWDGEIFVPLTTGMEDDRPTHLAINHQHLFLAFRGGSVQHSAIGDPYYWTAVLGAGELSIGEDVTGFIQEWAGVLVILGRNKVAVLYGNDSSDWNLDVIAEDAGGIEWTGQKVGWPIYMDDIGLRDMRTTQSFGDFRMGSVSQLVEPIFKAKKKNGIKPIASVRCRAKDQYRLFWDDGTGITVYVGKKTPEILPFDLGKVVYTACSSEDADGNEVMFFGSDDGYVYQLDAGTSLDGESLGAYLRLPFNHVGSPTQNKRWHKATLEVDSDPSVRLGLTAEFAYADPDQPPSVEQSFDVRGGGGFWNEASWNEFYWSSPVKGLAEAHIDGLGRNISIAVVSDAIYEQPHTIHGLTLHFSYRGLVR